MMNKNTIQLQKNYEKLIKVALLKLEKQQDTDVITILNEFYDFLNHFLKMKNEDKNRFISLFCINNVDISIDIEIENVQWGFLQLYIDSHIKIWKSAYTKQSYQVSKELITIFNKGFINFRSFNIIEVDEFSIKSFYKCNQSFLEFYKYVATETSLQYDFHQISLYIKDYIDWIIQIDKTKQELYLKILITNIDSDNIYNSRLILDPLQINESSHIGLQSIIDIYYKIWEKSYENDLENSALYTLSVIEKILKELLKKGKDYITISNNFIRLIYNINFELNKSQNRFTKTSLKASYKWFFEIVYDRNFDLQHIINLQVSLFISIRYSIINGNNKLFNSFFEYIIDGFWYPIWGMLPNINSQIHYSKDPNIVKFEKAKDKLITESIQALSLQDYQKVIYLYEETITILKLITIITPKEKDKLISEIRSYIDKQFKYNILQQTVIWFGSYCLFLKRYDFIEDMLYFNQPKDSPVLWSNQDINPLNIGRIITLFNRGYELDSNITFLWDKHHEFLTYYKNYLAILLMNAINHNKREGKSWRNEYSTYFNNKYKSSQEIENVGYSIDSFCNIVKLLKTEATLLKGCGLKEELAEEAIKLLKNISSNLEIQKEEINLTAEIDPEKAQNFINNVYENYQKGGAFKNIINYYNTISVEKETHTEDQLISLGINEITLKSYFAKNDDGMYFGWTDSYAHELIFQENFNLKRIFIEKSFSETDKIDQSIIVNKLDEIGQLDEKVLVFLNIYPTYEIFGSNTDFISKDDIQESNCPSLNEFVGRYKGADIYTYYDETNWKQLLVLKKHKEQGIGKIKYYVPISNIEGFNIKENFYWKILDLNETNEIVDKIIDEQPYWLIQQASDKKSQLIYLKKQVNLIILYKINLELPDDFQGWFYNLEIR